MSDELKSTWSGALLLVLSALLTATATVLGFTAKSVYELNGQMCAMRTQIEINSSRLTTIEQHGSPVIQAIMVRLDTLQTGQARIEKALEEHMKKP